MIKHKLIHFANVLANPGGLSSGKKHMFRTFGLLKRYGLLPNYLFIALDTLMPGFRTIPKYYGGKSSPVPSYISSKGERHMAIKWILQTTQHLKQKSLPEKMCFSINNIKQHTGELFKLRHDLVKDLISGRPLLGFIRSRKKNILYKKFRWRKFLTEDEIKKQKKEEEEKIKQKLNKILNNQPLQYKNEK